MNTILPILRTNKRGVDSQNHYAPTFSSWIDDLINSSFDSDGLSVISTSVAPAVNIIENDKAFELHMAVPGYSKSDFKINIDQQQLSVSSEQKHEKEETSDHYTRREFGYSSFKRSFELPKTVNKEQISASYEDGLLKIFLPKLEESQVKAVRQIEIE
jgi:HSP20 family protein